MKSSRNFFRVFIIVLLCSFLSFISVFGLLTSLPRDVRIAILIFVWMVLLISLISSLFISNVEVILFLTLAQLLWPIFGFSIKLFFHSTLFFGPGMAIAVNMIGIVGTLFCLIGLYLKEKLMIIKVFFLPFLQALDKINLSRKSFNSLVEKLENETTTTFRLLSSQFQSFDVPPDWMLSDSGDVEENFTKQLQDSCIKIAGEYLSQCPNRMLPACRSVFPPPILDKISCPPLVSAACTSQVGNITTYCRLPNIDFHKLGNHVENMKLALNALNDSVAFETPFASLGQFRSESIEMYSLPLEILQNVTILFWVFVGVCWIYFILKRFYLSVKIYRRYKEDLSYENEYLDHKWVQLNRPELFPLTKREETFHSESVLRFLACAFMSLLFDPAKLAKDCSLILIVLTVAVADSAIAVIFNFMSEFTFKVPIHGAAGFMFNIQGTSTVAQLLRAVLGGFALISEDCDYADSNQCIKQHQPIDHRAMFLLWSLAIFYYLHHGITQRTEYILCRICDFLCPALAARRTQHLVDNIIRRRQNLTKMIMDIVVDFNKLDPEIKRSLCSSKSPDQQRLLVVKFYSVWRPFVKWIPTFVVNIISETCYGLVNVNCQICWFDSIHVYCNCALLCQKCSFYIHNASLPICPICDHQIVRVSRWFSSNTYYYNSERQK